MKLDFDIIKKVYELSDRYYLYLDKSHACVMLKNAFTKGEEKDFREFLIYLTSFYYNYQ